MSTGVGMSACCLSGTIQNGTPKGSVREIGGLNTYISEPSDGSKAKSIIFIVDIFGYEFPNVRLLADNYAAAGFYVYIPDVHQGDSLPIDFLQTVEPPLPQREAMGMVEKTAATAKVGATLGPWLVRHREGVSKPLMDGFINTIRTTAGTDKVGAIGFCWGGRYAILATHEAGPGKGVDAAYACHPSLVAIPADFDPVARPLSLALGDKDGLLGEKEIGAIQEVMGKKTGVPHEIRVYEGQVHGFALRGDWSGERDKKAMDDAEAQGIEWFKKYLS
ncbi:dienelactone hydrolase family protein-like protein [Saccharata proteae CBS 121410]|uniref:Dienelactone hydrolase family protein-like protein n=1 Tax=Saccharata proteae CBS 121410 TaxID=1314787 RepID=A0A9P4LZ38_9PEZI|nr:dienelactone hydrolase family protein-like protein [Saccharata proteae CBS 121410]